MKPGKKLCGAKTRSGQPCKCYAMENGRCRIHGGATPKGSDSPHFIHGGYSKYLLPEIADKVAAYQDADPLDLTHELALARGLLAHFLSQVESPMTSGAADAATTLIDRVRKTVESINRMKNDTALTAAEITYLATRAAEVVTRYIDDPSKQKAFIQDLFGGITGANSAIPGRLAGQEDRG